MKAKELNKLHGKKGRKSIQLESRRQRDRDACPKNVPYSHNKRNKNETMGDYRVRMARINKERRLRKRNKAKSIK